MQITYEAKQSKFIIKCRPDENDIAIGMPDRRFRKATAVWAAPALRRNIEYMQIHMNNPAIYSKEALAAYNEKRKEIAAPLAQSATTWPAWYRFKNEPKKHQYREMVRAFDKLAFAFFFEQGLGKTYTSINLAAAWRMCNIIDAVVVVCPSSIKLVWEDEVAEHCPIPAQVAQLVAGKYSKADKFIENKTDFQWFVVGIEALSQGNADKYLERFLLSRRCMFIIDESSTIKTPDTTRTDKAIKLGKLANRRAILSGTSVTQGLEDLYTQFKFLDPNIIGFNSFYTFRANYCTTISITVGVDQRGNDINTTKIVGYKNEAEFFDLIRPYTARVEKKDAWEDMPEKIYTNRYVQMNPEQKRLYKEMEQDMFIEIERAAEVGYDVYEYEAKGVLEKTLRLMQITGGHYPFDNGTNIVAEPIPGKNPKIAEIMQILNEVPGKIIVWCTYRPEIELIADTLDSKMIRYVEFHGGCDNDWKTASVRSFRSDPSIRVFLATKAAARGLTLVEASTAVYYSTSPSLDDYEQSQDRIHRYGQTKGCNYIHLICEGTKDKDVFTSLRNKKNLAQMAYDMMKSHGAVIEGEYESLNATSNHEMEQALLAYEDYQ